MNPNGSYVGDGMDQSDEANFNLANQRNQQNMMAQLALAQLRSGDARYAAERSDNMGMAGINALSSMNGQNLNHQDRLAELQAAANRDKAQFGYLAGHDTAAQNQWQQRFDLDKNDISNRQQLEGAQKDLALKQIAAMTAQEGRAQAAQNGAVPYTAKTTAGRQAQQGAALGGLGLGQQGAAAESADLPALQQSAQTEGQGVAADLAALEKRSSSIKPWQAIQPDEISTVKTRLDKLHQMFVAGGDDDATAQAKVQNLVRSNMPTNHTTIFGENPTASLYRALGIQLPN